MHSGSVTKLEHLITLYLGTRWEKVKRYLILFLRFILSLV